MTTRQKLDSQYNENLAVKTEFDQLPNNNDDVKPEDRREVYKLIANVLIKQDIGESKSNVNRRIEFLKTEQLSHSDAPSFSEDKGTHNHGVEA